MYTLPYQSLLDNGWSIVGMNHYYVDGVRHLYCAIVKADTCIQVEGKNDLDVFSTLRRRVKRPGERDELPDGG